MIERETVAFGGVKRTSAFVKSEGRCSHNQILFFKLAEYAGAYDKLPEETRLALEMRFIGGLTMPQIGRELGLLQNAVNRRINTAPNDLYRIMLEEAQSHSLNVPFSSVVRRYSALQEDLRAAGQDPREFTRPYGRRYSYSQPEA
jgi:hypothetical protein